MLPLILSLSLSAHAQDPSQALVDEHIESIAFNHGLAPSSRSSVPPLVTDTLELLAEIAYERARAESYEVLHEKLEALVCEEFSVPASPSFKVDFKYSLGGTPVEGSVELPAGQILPRTCEIVQNSNDLVSLINSAEDLGSAVESDLLRYTSKLVFNMVVDASVLKDQWKKDSARTVLEAMFRVFSDNIIDGEPPSVNDARQLFVALSRHPWAEGATNDAEAALGVGLKISFATLGKCLKTEGSCDAADIATAFENPWKALVGEESAEQEKSRQGLEEIRQSLEEIRDSLKKSDKNRTLLDAALAQLPSGSDLTGLDGFIKLYTGRDASAVGKAYQKLRPYLEALVARSLQMLEARRGTERLQARQGFESGMDILQLIVQVDTIAKVDSSADVAWLEPQDVLSRYRRLVLALIDQDLPEATLEGLGLVELVAGATLEDARVLQTIIEAHIENNPDDKGKWRALARKPWEMSEMQQTTLLGEWKSTLKDSVSGISEEDGLSAIKNATNSKGDDLLYRNINRVIPVLRVLASNSQSIATSSVEPEQAETLREARKESLEALINATTDREQRGGDWVTSIGASVGMRGVIGPACVGSIDCESLGESAHAGFVPLTMPMGLTWQRLPAPRSELLTSRKLGWNGVHTQLSVVDLAQFLPDHGESSADMEWADFLLIGGQVGWGFGRPDRFFVVGLDGRYVPYDDATWQAGVFASYYVPFFDFN